MKIEKKIKTTDYSQVKFDFNLSVSSKRKNKLLVVGFFTQKGKSSFQHPLICHKINTISLISEEQKIYVCLGVKKKFNQESLQTVAGLLTTLDEYSVDFELSSFTTKSIDEEKILDVFARIWYYAFHSLWQHQTDLKPQNKPSFHMLSKNKKSFQLLMNLKIIFQAVSFCRNLQDEAPNILNSEYFAQIIEDSFAKNALVDCQILDKKAIEKEKMHLLLAVNAGSQYEPRVVVLKYFGDSQNKKKVTVLLGKGITFDTGGYSLKPANYLIGMKFDMSGAAIVLATMQAISALKLAVNVVAIAPLTDNALGSKATLVESVIKSKNGKTVEITNTDAEGRLILADGISYAIEHFEIVNLIELSTLTGAITVTLGGWMTGAFPNPNGQQLYAHFAKASQAVNEKIWKLPVIQANFTMMKSKIADLVNASKEYKGGASNAAAFLFNFVGKTPFLHLDIAGTATKPDNQLGTGVMIQTLLQYFFNLEKNKKK